MAGGILIIKNVVCRLSHFQNSGPPWPILTKLYMQNAHTRMMSKSRKKNSIARFFQKYFFEIIILVILEDFDKFDVFAQKFAKVAKFSIWRKKKLITRFFRIIFRNHHFCHFGGFWQIRYLRTKIREIYRKLRGESEAS